MAATAFLAAACGSSSSNSSTSATAPAASATSASTAATSSTGATTTAAASAVIATKSVAGVGTVLVNGQGRTLYVFEPDHHAKVTCTGGCASVWPPVKLTGAKAQTSGEVKASLVSSDPDPAGGRVVTYNGWPLYTYVADTQAGSASGQGLNSSGGLWYVITPAGTVVTKKAHSSGGAGYSSSTY